MTIGSKRVAALAQRETPFYYYDMDLLRRTLDALQTALGDSGYHVHYALKANANLPILREMIGRGLGADCVSGNEVWRALEAGFPPERIVFAGVGKSDREIGIGLDAGIFCFNVESVQELEVIEALAAERRITAGVALRINPDLDAKTHHYITTGRDENKFGIPAGDMDAALAFLEGSERLTLRGLHVHIGSQITDLGVFEALCERINTIQRGLLEAHPGLDLPHLNLGGGLGIDYGDPDGRPVVDFARYFGIIRSHLRPLEGQQVHFELGRAIVAQCGYLISRVLFTKAGASKRFAILDAGMTELIRPALYQATHRIENLSAADDADRGEWDVVGPVCESADFFAKGVRLPEMRRGDLVAVRSAGAYGEVMASHYNLRELQPAVYSDELH